MTRDGETEKIEVTIKFAVYVKNGETPMETMKIPVASVDIMGSLLKDEGRLVSNDININAAGFSD